MLQRFITRLPITRCNPMLLEDCKIEDEFSSWKMDPSIDISRKDQVYEKKYLLSNLEG
jgi:hypothetical protein